MKIVYDFEKRPSARQANGLFFGIADPMKTERRRRQIFRIMKAMRKICRHCVGKKDALRCLC